MSYGFRIYNADARLTLDSARANALLVDFFAKGEGDASETRSYPALTGATIQAIVEPSLWSGTVTVTYPGGVPTVTYTKPNPFYLSFYGSITALVRLLTLPSASYYGARVEGDEGYTMISDLLPGFEFAEIVTPSLFQTYDCNANPLSQYFWGSGEYEISVPRSNYPEPPLALFSLPNYNSGAAGVAMSAYGTWDPATWRITFNVLGSMPNVYLFRKTQTFSQPGTGYGLRTYSAAGQCMFDSSRQKSLALMQPLYRPSWEYFNCNANTGLVTDYRNADYTPSAFTIDQYTLMFGFGFHELSVNRDDPKGDVLFQIYQKLYARDGGTLKGFGRSRWNNACGKTFDVNHDEWVPYDYGGPIRNSTAFSPAVLFSDSRFYA